MKWRFMAALMAVTLLVLIVQDVPLSGYLQRVEQERIVTSLERDAFVLAGRSTVALGTADAADDQTVTDSARRYRDAGGARVVVVDASATVVASSDTDDADAVIGQSYSNRPEITEALGGRIASGSRFSQTLGLQLLYVAVPVISGESVLGAVRLTYPERVVTETVTAQVRVLWIVALTSVLLAGIVGYIISAGITRRLGMLRTATERFAGGALDERAETASGAPELRSLAGSFNSMAERIGTLVQQQRRFASDASHQLRTPLTALRLRLERARDLVGTDPAAAADRLAAAEAEADRLGSLVEGLLLLSRSETSTVPVETTDAAAVARERVEHWHPLADESGVSIRYDGPDRAPAAAAPNALEQIVDNYIDNALAVSPAGSSIVVRAVADAATGGAIVHVLDEGPGLTDEQLARAFDRFWRGSSAEPGGTGLGLAIVDQLARASGGRARLARRSGSPGLDATVELPAPPAAPAR